MKQIFIIIAIHLLYLSCASLDKSVINGDTNYVENYLKSGGNPNAEILIEKGYKYMPLLNAAIYKNTLPLAERGELTDDYCFDTVKLLLKAGADPNKRSKDMYLPLDYAIHYNGVKNYKTVKSLLEAGAKVDNQLIGEIGSGRSIEIVKLLINYSDVNKESYLLCAPLFYVINLYNSGSKFKHDELKQIIQLLLDKKANINQKGRINLSDSAYINITPLELIEMKINNYREIYENTYSYSFQKETSTSRMNKSMSTITGFNFNTSPSSQYTNETRTVTDKFINPFKISELNEIKQLLLKHRDN